MRLALVGVLAVVLVLMAVLQYRWSLEVSRAERTRIEASLNTSVNQFRQEFYRELVQVSTAFHSDPTADADTFWSPYSERYQEWERTATRPDLVANVYVWQAEPAAEARLLMLHPADGHFDPVPWPATLAGLRARLEADSQQTPGAAGAGPGPELRAFVWTLEDRVPALLHPVFNFSRLRGGPWAASGDPAMRHHLSRRGDGARTAASENPHTSLAPPRVVLGFVIVELNRAAIDHLLGELAQRYFTGPEGFIYNVAVLSGAPAGTIVYRSDPQITVASLNPPDARAALVPATPGENRAVEGPPRNPSARPRGGRGTGWSGQDRGTSARPRGAIILSSASEEPWQLWARHRGGSLESVVAADRRRNLLVSFGVLLVLAVSMALIILSAQRARRLARLQMEFVAGVSHELRTPVTVICSAADNLAEGFVGSKDQVREYGAVIRNEGRRLAAMIEQILHFAAGQSRRAQYDMRPVAVSDAVEMVAANISSLPEAAGFTLERDIDPDLPPVIGGCRSAGALPGEPDLERAQIRRREPLGAGAR